MIKKTVFCGLIISFLQIHSTDLVPELKKFFPETEYKRYDVFIHEYSMRADGLKQGEPIIYEAEVCRVFFLRGEYRNGSREEKIFLYVDEGMATNPKSEAIFKVLTEEVLCVSSEAYTFCPKWMAIRFRTFKDSIRIRDYLEYGVHYKQVRRWTGMRSSWVSAVVRAGLK